MGEKAGDFSIDRMGVREEWLDQRQQANMTSEKDRRISLDTWEEGDPMALIETGKVSKFEATGKPFLP